MWISPSVVSKENAAGRRRRRWGRGQALSSYGSTRLNLSSPASATVLNTGRPRCVVPPFLGVTPPTICVPYAMACSLWNVPFLPGR
jgi:hypothetical protein